MPDQIVLSLTFALIMMIAGSGIFVLSRLCGQLSLAAGSYMAIGACVSAYFARDIDTDTAGLSGRGTSFVVALFAAIAITGAFSLIFGFVTYKFRGELSPISSISIAATVFYLLDQTDFLSGINAVDVDNSIEIGGKSFSEPSGFLILTLLIAFGIVPYVRNIARSPFSRSMRSINELTGAKGNERAATACAISPMNTIVGAHLICGLAAGAAGALYAQFLGTFQISSIDPWFGVFGMVVSLQILIFVSAGGLKSYWATLSAICFFVFDVAILSQYADSIDFIDFSKQGNVSPAHVAGILAALVTILVLQAAGRSAKNKL